MILSPAEIILIVPPFASTARPSLGAHSLQAACRQVGLSATVYYANLAFAALVGRREYESVCFSSDLLLGERCFAAAAFGLPPFGTGLDEIAADLELDDGAETRNSPTVEQLTEIEGRAAEWADHVADAVAAQGYRIVGCTTQFEQTSAAVALLNRIKRRRPGTITVMGGANCEGEMAEGVASLSSAVDFIFSGESDESFPRFAQEVLSGRRPVVCIQSGSVATNLANSPLPVYDEYFAQLEHYLSGTDQDEVWLPYESSRGCWWGQKQHCTFCGLNGASMAFRAKPAQRVIEDLQQLAKRHNNRKFFLTDNIMPYQYHETLIPQLQRQSPKLTLFYEQKANLTFGRVQALRNAGVTVIQPGIESLSTPILQRMRKGVTAAQNVALLRYAKATGVTVLWNLLYGFPGDEVDDYLPMIDLIPLLQHLPPPIGMYRARIDRFSPYHSQPEDFGIIGLSPCASYAKAYPSHAAYEKIAYRFDGTFASGSLEDREIGRRLAQLVGEWQDRFTSRPLLTLKRIDTGRVVLVDSRGLHSAPHLTPLTEAQVRIALCGAKTSSADSLDWALDRKVVVLHEGAFMPLATASEDLLREYLEPLQVLGPDQCDGSASGVKVCGQGRKQ